ncbi:MAG: class I SAM-dependent methyltransferase [Solirubrobacterales bacterium]
MAEKLYLDNTEATEAWNTVLYDRFHDYRHIFVGALTLFSDDALALDPPSVGDRVVDLGCGFGDTAQQLARIVGPQGFVVGIDAADRFIAQAVEESELAGVDNIEFRVADVQAEVPGGPYDYAFARMGTMFFANPVAAMRNVSAALRPGGKLCMIVWRQKPDNPFMFRTEEIVDRYVPPIDPEESDALTCGPGPFSMANADTTSGVLGAAGFEQIALRRVDVEIPYGSSPEEAVEAAFAIGPAAETMRLAGETADELRPQIVADIRDLALELQRSDGVVVAPGSAWVVTARVP